MNYDYKFGNNYYKYNGKTTYVSPSMKNRKVFAKKLF